jgi:hypothetical protein
MFGFGILLMALADRFARRKSKNERTLCDICGQRFPSYEDAEGHKRNAHTDAAI